MDEREHYALGLICPKCGAAGVAQCSESEAEDSGPDFKVHTLPAGFAYSKESSFPQTAEISCCVCKAVVNRPSA